MPQRIRKLRFPDGDTEYRTTQVDLKVGTIIRSRGKEWVITSVTDGLAVLNWPNGNGHGVSADGYRQAVDGDGAAVESLPADPMAQHRLAGEEPVELETLEEI